MEVYYKDFRGSEMLDIRMPSSVPLPEKRFPPVPSSKKEKGVGHEHQERKRYGVSTPVCFLLGGLAITLSAIAWYAVLRFLLKL